MVKKDLVNLVERWHVIADKVDLILNWNPIFDEADTWLIWKLPIFVEFVAVPRDILDVGDPDDGN